MSMSVSAQQTDMRGVQHSALPEVSSTTSETKPQRVVSEQERSEPAEAVAGNCLLTLAFLNKTRAQCLSLKKSL